MSSSSDLRAVALLSLAGIACFVAPAAEEINTDPTKATPACSLTLSGAVTGTHDCHVELTPIDRGQWEFRFNTVGESAPNFEARARWTGAPIPDREYSLQTPSAMTYALATADLSADPTAVWEAGEHVTDALSAVITVVNHPSTNGPCGHFNATLEPQSGSTASGAVQVVANF
jgi:hypothetical protein